MEIQQARYFVALCETLNFTRAAERCNVTQPSLTRAIRLLEDELGGPLFNRERNRTHLTELGRLVEPHVREVVSQAQSARAQARAFLQLRRARLRLGVTRGLPLSPLEAVLERYAAAYPETELENPGRARGRAAGGVARGRLRGRGPAAAPARHRRPALPRPGRAPAAPGRAGRPPARRPRGGAARRAGGPAAPVRGGVQLLGGGGAPARRAGPRGAAAGGGRQRGVAARAGGGRAWVWAWGRGPGRCPRAWSGARSRRRWSDTR